MGNLGDAGFAAGKYRGSDGVGLIGLAATERGGASFHVRDKVQLTAKIKET